MRARFGKVALVPFCDKSNAVGGFQGSVKVPFGAVKYGSHRYRRIGNLPTPGKTANNGVSPPSV